MDRGKPSGRSRKELKRGDSTYNAPSRTPAGNGGNGGNNKFNEIFTFQSGGNGGIGQGGNSDTATADNKGNITASGNGIYISSNGGIGTAGVGGDTGLRTLSTTISSGIGGIGGVSGGAPGANGSPPDVDRTQNAPSPSDSGTATDGTGGDINAFNSGTVIAGGNGIQAVGVSNVVVKNSGIVRSDGTGVLVQTGTGVSIDDSEVTVTNDGGAIIAGSGGARGTAINVSGAPAPSAVTLVGNGGMGAEAGNADLSEFVQGTFLEGAGVTQYGYIYGDILLDTNADAITVEEGLTVLDGDVNSAGNLFGDFTIASDGKLVMIQNDAEGASQIYANTFTQEAGGRLAMELTASNAPGDYSQVMVNTANVNGTLAVGFQADLYADTTTYDNIVESNNLTGNFDAVEDNSLFLEGTAVADGANNIDLVVDRLAFNSIEGLTKNQNAASTAIEDTYADAGLGSPAYQNMVAGLFLLDEEEFPQFLDQLAGAEYAQMLQSVLWSNRGMNRVVTERMACDRDGVYAGSTSVNGLNVASLGDGTNAEPTADLPMAAGATGCFTPGKASLWVRGFGNFNEHYGDIEAPGYDEEQYGILGGADYAFNETWFAGLALGYFHSDADYYTWGGRKGASGKYDGLQVALYGGYDDRVWYARGVMSYGTYNGKMNRDVGLADAAGNLTPVDPYSSPDSNVFGFYGETGRRFDMGGIFVTPYLGLNFAQAKLKSETEKDPYGTGAALRIRSSKADSFSTVVGARVSGDFMMSDNRVTPFLSLGWEHEFDRNYQKVKMSFADGPEGADFTSISARTPRDSLVIGMGSNFAISETMDIGVGYDGRLNNKYTTHSITGRFGFQF